MLEDIYQRTREAAAQYIESDRTPRLRGITVGQLLGLEWEPVPREEANWRTRMNGLFKGLQEYGIGLVITVDEVRVTLDEMRDLVSIYQLFVGEGKKVALLMAGLPHQVSALLRDGSISFLRRAVQYHLGGIPDYEVRDVLARTIEDGGREAGREALDAMVGVAGGIPYMMQLVGYRSWARSPYTKEISLRDVREGSVLAQRDMESRIFDATYRELSEGDLAFLRAMLDDGHESRISDIAKRMGVSANYAAPYRSRLLEQGVIGERGRGKVGFDLPFFAEYLRERT